VCLRVPSQDLYASAIGTCILQLQEIPLRPKEYDGAICLWDLKEGVDESAIRMALQEFGAIASCELGVLVVVRFDEHASAVAAKRATSRLTALCAGVDTLYNERSYGGRKNEEGLDDDNGRGWVRGAALRLARSDARVPMRAFPCARSHARVPIRFHNPALTHTHPSSALPATR